MAARANPASRLEVAFRHIAERRMAGIPILNAVLEVEAIGFVRYGGWWLGVLLTPWCMNLMLLEDEAALPAVPPAGEVLLTLPGAELPFMAGYEEQVGDYRMCSLFSPVLEFADQASARATAQAVLAELLPPPRLAGPDLGRRRLFGLGT